MYPDINNFGRVTRRRTGTQDSIISLQGDPTQSAFNTSLYSRNRIRATILKPVRIFRTEA